MTLSPTSTSVAVNGTAQFTASVQGSASAIIWSVNGIQNGNSTVGTIQSIGATQAAYTAPASVPNPATVVVAAAAQSDPSQTGVAQVTIAAPAVSPSVVEVTTSQTVQFQVAGPNLSNANVQWSVDGIAAGSSTVGVITNSGLYASPSVAGQHTITATSQTDPAVKASATLYVTDFPGTLSWRTDQSLTGQNSHEFALTPALIGSHFGKIFACPLDGLAYAQPLYVPNLNVPDPIEPNLIHHNVVFVATENDSVYAFDADASPCQQIWQTSFISPLNVTTVPACPANTDSCNDVGSSDIQPQIGITGTPVIDPQTTTLYVVAKTKEVQPVNPTYVQRLHALDLFTGNDKTSTAITASVPGTAYDANGGPAGTVTFNPLRENQRAGLALLHASNGKKYVLIAFASHGDVDPFHGWLFAYDTTQLTQPAAVLNVTADSQRGGIWQSGAPPSIDSQGNIFLTTGDGTFTAASQQYSDTLLRLQLDVSSGGFDVEDTFTPYTQAALALTGNDFGSTGVMILPDQSSSPNPHLAVTGSKEGILYLVNRDNLGGYSGPNGPDKVLQSLSFSSVLFGTPAYWQGTNDIYVAAQGAPLQAYSVSPSTGLLSGPISHSFETFAMIGGAPSVSSNGSNTGVVWLIDCSGYDPTGAAPQPAILRAYDATNLANAAAPSKELYDSSEVPSDAAGPAVKFTVPTIANGKVYVGTQTELSVYGLLP